MACCVNGGNSIITQLKDLATQIDKPPSSKPCCPPCSCPAPCPLGAYAEVCISCPPPILAPTNPTPIKPLRLPGPPCPPPEMSQQEAERLRVANFYNNFNIDWKKQHLTCPPKPMKRWCEDYEDKPIGGLQKKDKCPDKLPGCPGGFKPCTMELCPPANGSPCGVWSAKILPCSPKPRKRESYFYEPGPCCRPGCKHWKPKHPPCLYDSPCKAHCYDHPVGIKPSGRFP